GWAGEAAHRAERGHPYDHAGEEPGEPLSRSAALPRRTLGPGETARRRFMFGSVGRRVLRIAALLLAFATSSALGQTYPNRPVRVIVGYPPGGVTDLVARLVGPKLAELWSQAVVIENRPGAAGVIAGAFVAESPPDGSSTFAHGGFAENAVLHANLSYDPLQDFAHIAPFASQPFVLAASPASGLRSVGELVAAAKARPGSLNYSSAGVGGGTHL